MAFVDESEISVRSGEGGPGMVSFKSAKNAPKLGPDGGDGGFGGSVLLVGKAQFNSLSGLYYRRMYAAEPGMRGGTNGCTGRNGEDLEIFVPVGTQVYDKSTGRLMTEILEDGQRVILAPGGKRGLGNMRFLSPTHQAPHENTQGNPGVELELRLELKLIADVGFAGFPNAGKSTLLSSISSATPKIADYPFTTLIPQLGVVAVPEMDPWGGSSFVAADIPGLIEGASEGRGLGHEFLRHLERTKLVIYVIDPFALDEMPAIEAYRTLENELRTFSDNLANKRHLVVLTKSDIAPIDFDWNKVEQPLHELGLETLRLSAVTQDGIAAFKRRLWLLVEEERNKIEAVAVPLRHFRAEDEGYTWVVRADDGLGLGI